MAYIFNDEWSLEPPKIITLIVSGKSQRWKNEKQIKDFQIGISKVRIKIYEFRFRLIFGNNLKAALSTNMWILTNGINSSITNYICSAIIKEYNNVKLKHSKKLEITFQLFAIADKSNLIYENKFQQFNNQEVLNLIEFNSI